MSGDDTAADIIAMQPPVRPVPVALTGLDEVDAQPLTSAAGFDFHIHKPANVSRLLAFIEAYSARMG